jgi:hypothetical protein
VASLLNVIGDDVVVMLGEAEGVVVMPLKDLALYSPPQ